MSDTSQLGASLGFPLGFNPSTIGAQGEAKASGSAIADLVVTAQGLVKTQGQIPYLAKGQVTTYGTANATVAAANIRVTQEALEVLYEQAADAKIIVTQEVAEVLYEYPPAARIECTQVVLEVIIEQLPFLKGVVSCSGSAGVTGHFVATARGIVNTSGKISAVVNVPVIARGQTVSYGTALLTVQFIGATGQASAQGKAQANLGVLAGGQTIARGSILPTVAIIANAQGVVYASGKVPMGLIQAVAVGQVRSQGSAVIGINGSDSSCSEGKDKATAPIPNFVF